jgi:hypothetical protein
MDGYSLRKIEAVEGMPKRLHVLKWLRENPLFQTQYAHAREEQAEALADEMIDISDDITRDLAVDENGKLAIDGFAAQRARVMIDTRKWIASKLKPKKYGDKQILSGDPENPIFGNADERIAELARKAGINLAASTEARNPDETKV